MIRNRNGFTIVELLIVIVVIAILAAITIVAYNGIQARAKLTQQVAELDRIGKAIQLWSADTGQTLGTSGAGYGGKGVGTFTATGGSYTSVSVEQLLKNSGYLTGTVGGSAFSDSTVMVAPCTDYNDSRWLVFAIVSPAPSESVADQIADTNCTNGLATTYTSGTYNRNLIKAY